MASSASRPATRTRIGTELAARPLWLPDDLGRVLRQDGPRRRRSRSSSWSLPITPVTRRYRPLSQNSAGENSAMAIGMQTRLRKKCMFQDLVTFENSHRPPNGMPTHSTRLPTPRRTRRKPATRRSSDLLPRPRGAIWIPACISASDGVGAREDQGPEQGVIGEEQEPAEERHERNDQPSQEEKLQRAAEPPLPTLVFVVLSDDAGDA